MYIYIYIYMYMYIYTYANKHTFHRYSCIYLGGTVPNKLGNRQMLLCACRPLRISHAARSANCTSKVEKTQTCPLGVVPLALVHAGIPLGTSHLIKNIFPGQSLHEKGSQRQIGVGTLVNSQERRASVVLWIMRLSTAGQPRALFLHRFP